MRIKRSVPIQKVCVCVPNDLYAYKMLSGHVRFFFFAYNMLYMRTKSFVCVKNVLYMYNRLCTSPDVGGGGCLASYFINTILEISARINDPRT